jgi:branched-chain amino acid transport system permease protein
MAVAALLSFVVSLPSLRLHGDYFVIATFGFQMILFSILNNWTVVTKGPLGISGIPQVGIVSWRIGDRIQFLVLAGLFAIFAYLIVWRIVNSPFGRVLHAIREDELLAQALGKYTLLFKVSTFAVSASLAAVAGSLYAHYTTYIDPSSFTVMESILVISMVVIGGAGNLWGPLVGAFVLVSLPEALRFVGLSNSVAANLRQIGYGSLLIIFMMVRPRGLVGSYRFGR